MNDFSLCLEDMCVVIMHLGKREDGGELGACGDKEAYVFDNLWCSGA